MDSRTHERSTSTDAVEFIRFCHRRRRVGWPELYDEMCAVANRGLYRGMGIEELRAEGVGFSLWEMPALAALVAQIVSEEHEQRAALRQRSPAVRLREAGDRSTGEPPADPALRLSGAPASV